MSKDKRTSESVSVNLLPGAILLSAIIVSATLLYTQGNKNDSQQDNELNIKGETEELFMEGEIRIDDDPYLGNIERAEYAIVEFSDYECPFCKKHSQETLPQLKENYINDGKMIYVFRDYEIHGDVAYVEAYIGECIQEEYSNEKYFEYHDILYENTDSNESNMTEESILALLPDIDVDSSCVKDCLDSDAFVEEVEKDMDDLNILSEQLASKYPCQTNDPYEANCFRGIGTPFFIVGKLNGDSVKGYIITGAFPYSQFELVVDKL